MNIGAFGENFPYTNFHDLNLDWIIQEMKTEKDFRENDLIPLIDSRVEESELNLAINYIPESFTLKFTLAEVDNNG